MSVSAATNAQSSTSQTATTVTNPSSQLNESDFLNLLIGQLENQDPLNPESSTGFAAQMAQFSSLQGMNDLNGSFNQLYGVNLLGLTVQATDPSTNTSYSGEVTGTSIQNNTVYLTVNGSAIPTSWVTSVSEVQSGLARWWTGSIYRSQYRQPASRTRPGARTSSSRHPHPLRMSWRKKR